MHHVLDVSLEFDELDSINESPGASKLLLARLFSFTSFSSFVIFSISFIRW